MVSMHFFVKVWTVRMGKKEGLSNTVKRKVHDVYVKDKTDVKLLGSRPWMCFPYVLFVGADHLYNLFPFVEHFWAYPKPSWRPSWFIHENVKAFPLDYLENKFKLHYSCQSTNISPQRFGKPMNRSIVAKEHKCAICCKSYRCVCLLGYFFNFLVCVCVWVLLARLRTYRIFYDKTKYVWNGPNLRALLKLMAPHQELHMTADDMYFMTKSELATRLQ